MRGRAGYAADRVLLYLFANVQTNFNGVTTTHTQSGWTGGAGIEWAFANIWTAKIEYLYVNLGNAVWTVRQLRAWLPAAGRLFLSASA